MKAREKGNDKVRDRREEKRGREIERGRGEGRERGEEREIERGRGDERERD